MILLSNTTEQTLAPGQSITFDDVLLHSGCGECHRRSTNSVKLRANGVYDIFFHANIGSPTAATPVRLQITLGGDTPLPETIMQNTPAAITDRNNVGTATSLKNCCGDFDRVFVTNTGSDPVIVAAGSSLKIARRS